MVVLKSGMGTNLIVWMQGQTPTVGRGGHGCGAHETERCDPPVPPMACVTKFHTVVRVTHPSSLSPFLPHPFSLSLSILHSLNHHHVGRWLIRHALRARCMQARDGTLVDGTNSEQQWVRETHLSFVMSFALPTSYLSSPPLSSLYSPVTPRRSKVSSRVKCCALDRAALRGRSARLLASGSLISPSSSPQTMCMYSDTM